MRCAAAVVLQIVTRPNRGVGFVERQLVRAELAAEKSALPREMTLNRRPHPPCIIQIARPQQVTEERIHCHKVHVVVRLRQVAVRVEAGFVAREIHILIGGRNFFRNGIRVLLFGKARKVRRRALVPAKFVADIRPAPTEQARPPRHRAVHERLLLLIPDRVRRDVQCSRSSINERVRRLDQDSFGDGAPMFLGSRK